MLTERGWRFVLCSLLMQEIKAESTGDGFMTPEDTIKLCGRVPIAFVSSKYKGDIKANVAKAIEYGRIAFEKGFYPIVPHLYLPQILNDRDYKERRLAEKACLEFVIFCEVFMCCGEMPPDSFMNEEYAQAVRCNRLIIRVD